MNKVGRISLTTLVFCLCWAALASAQSQKMYKWTDEDGVVHFSDSMPEGQTFEEQNLPAASQPANAKPDEQDNTAPSIAQQRRDEIARKHQEAKAADAANDARCAALQAEVDRLEPNRRVFFTNEDGETERMDDVERTDRVAELKDQIARDCG